MKTLFFTLTVVIAIALCNASTANAQNNSNVIAGGGPPVETEPSNLIRIGCNNSVAGIIVNITYNNDGTATITLDLFNSVTKDGTTIYQTNAIVGTRDITFPCYNWVDPLNIGTIYSHCY